MEDNKITVDQCSLYTVYIEPIFIDQADKTKEIDKTSATGSIYQYSGKYYLVSNWHVFSGRNAISLDPIHKQAALPEKIRIHFPVDGQIGITKTIDYPLKDKDGGAYFLARTSRKKQSRCWSASN